MKKFEQTWREVKERDESIVDRLIREGVVITQEMAEERKEKLEKIYA